MPSENQAVDALRRLSVFGPDQGGAYREHYSEIAAVLGADIPTKLVEGTAQWCRASQPGVRILTGNAGTGKTAAAQAFCRAGGGELPTADGLVEVADKKWVLKDLSGLPNQSARLDAVKTAMEIAQNAQVFICANEGVLRDVVEALGHAAASLASAMDAALRQGAATVENAQVINVNRQRPTGAEVWDRLVLYLVREELWTPCDGCPVESHNCPHQANAAAMRSPEAREGIRTLVRLACGEAVPTVREILAILAWSITGGQSCEEIKAAVRDSGDSAFTSKHGYFSRILGLGLAPEVIERSPLLIGMRSGSLGEVADIEVDEWLRDPSNAPTLVRNLAGQPNPDENNAPYGDLAGSQSHLDRVKTKVGTMTFHRLGEIIATSEDVRKVEAGLDALVDEEEPALNLWRRRVFFEGPASLGGSVASVTRLLSFHFLGDLLGLAGRIGDGYKPVLELTEIVKGLNYLVTGFSSANEGLIVPDPSCLFARNPGTFRPARPSLVHSRIDLEHLDLAVPDTGFVAEQLDVDHIEVLLVVDGRHDRVLRIGPRMHEAVREAALFEGPVGHGIAEMTDLRGFYGHLATDVAPTARLQVADPLAHPPALITITLPRF